MPDQRTASQEPAAGVVKDPLHSRIGWAFFLFALAIPLGDIAVRVSTQLAGGVPMTADRSRFLVVNALTLTGFQTAQTTGALPLATQIIVFALMLIGIVVPLLVGTLAASRILRSGWSHGQIFRWSVGLPAALIALGALLLWASGQHLWPACFLSTSALGNCGLYLTSLPKVTTWQTQLVLLPLAIIGSLGLPVILALRSSRRGPAMHHATTALAWTAGLYLVFLLVVALSSASVMHSLAGASAQSINTRTLGLPWDYARDWPRLMQWLLILAMLIGGNSASTAGGLKATTLAEIIRGLRRTLSGAPPARPFGVAVLWLLTYLALATAAVLVLLWCEPTMRPDRIIFETISALSNVGLSHDVLSLVSPSLDVLTLTMLAGRIVPLLILWWMARQRIDTDLLIG